MEHDLVVEDLEYAHNKYATLQRNYTTTKSEMKTQISSWVKKNEGHSLERQADEEEWRLDRSRWEMDKQKWEYEKFEMNRQIQQLRQELQAASQASHSKPRKEGFIHDRSEKDSKAKNKTVPPVHVIDDSLSDATPENNSMAAEDDVVGYEAYYPFTNGLHPKLNLF